MDSVFLLWSLTTIAAVTDVWRRRIPNALTWLAAGMGLAWWATGYWRWPHLAWAAGAWCVYDGIATLRPGSLGYGDVKWATVILGFLGPLGLLVVACGHLGILIWGTICWWRQGRTTPWRTMTGPWAPGAWVGLTGLIGLSWYFGLGRS